MSTGRVRVYSRVTETPVSENVNLREEHATIERRAVDRPATEADLREGSVEIGETAEEAIVGKTARVVEEVIVGKESSQRTETVNATVRGTEVEVERDTGTPETGSSDPRREKPV
ncbi:YsnF/AvaK domain-containing protein [Paraburkholderia xenovorans]|uniref:YsnF/AvaK domain-containing protein n=1 Tax=Paraburkholderia xenovorans TaxID=36873 RepID=UPI0038BDC151